MADNPLLTLLRTDNGNCRVYYRQERRLYCFQEDRRDEFTLYTCSRDGEPSHEVPLNGRGLDALPDDDSATARSFRKWAKHELGMLE